jgi:type VI secretion system protein ImpA
MDMASKEVLDLPKLCSALAGDQPTGLDPRSDTSPKSPYYAAKDARNAARAVERKITAGSTDVSPPNWGPVRDLSVKILAEQAKDLEIATYLIEALVRMQGFAGLRDGFRLARGLVEQFWEALYPLPDEDGLETRVAPLTGLNGADAEGTLIGPIARVPITEGSNAGPYAFCDYQQAVAINQITSEAAREAKLKQGGVAMEMIERAAQETSAPFFINLMEDLDGCLEEFGRLEFVLQDKCGNHAPPTSKIRSSLQACKDAILHIAGAKLAVAMAAAKEEAPGGAVGAAGSPAAVVGTLQDRESAFESLLKVAEFFRRTEPHSPLSYTLEQAVRWGRMSLPELMAELVPDEGPRRGFFKQVGIRTPEG